MANPLKNILKESIEQPVEENHKNNDEYEFCAMDSNNIFSSFKNNTEAFRVPLLESHVI